MREWETTMASNLLSVLATLIGLVSETRPVFFLGSKKRLAKLKPAGGVLPAIRSSRTLKSTGAARSGAALQAEKGMPSGPGAVFLE